MRRLNKLSANDKIKAVTILCVSLFILLLPNLYAKIGEQEKGNLNEALNSQSFSIRYQAAINFPSGSVDTLKSIDLFISALKTEIESPISIDTMPGSYASVSDMLIRQYIFAITRLGPAILPTLKANSDSLTGQIKDLLLITRGFLADSAAHDQIKSLIINSGSNDKKVVAIIALSAYNDTEDTLLFKSLLSDPYNVRIVNDHIMANGDFIDIVFPIREEAATALRKLGFKVTSNKLGDFHVVGYK